MGEGAIPARDQDASHRRIGASGLSADRRYQHCDVLLTHHFQVCWNQGHRALDPRGNRVDNRDVFFYALAVFLLDRVGRRPLLLVGIAGQVIGLAVLGAAFEFKQVASFKCYIAIGGLVIYVAAFAIGLRPVFWLLISEIYSLKFRGAAMSAVTVTNWGMNMAVAVTFLTIIYLIGHAGTFWLYGAIAVGAWIFCYRLVPETKGKTLEQIEAPWRSAESPRKV